MSLTKNSEEMPLLTVYDEEVIEKDKTPTIDINQHQFSTKNLAAIIGVKPKQVKAYRMLKGTDATRICGYRGAKGVLEILSPSKSKYRQLKKKGCQKNFKIAK